ncbi:MAG TPA: 3'-5' exonuclease [Candidatus Absconditabacterales bacterium]|nr:3'-5' exonuclease [Candidatus Absconditabacterales bacterium]
MQNIKEYLATKLNEEQLKAALHTDTSSLILAGAGSGKTRTLTYKIAYLMFAMNIRPNNILAVTFTNKAANEMKERLVELADEIGNLDFGSEEGEKNSEPGTLNSTHGNDSINDFLDFVEETSKDKNKSGYTMNDFKWIGTFHSVFLKILKEDIDRLGMKYDKNFSIIDSDDSQKMMRDILKKFGLNETFKPQEAKGFISKQKNNGFDPKMFESKVDSDYDQNIGKVYVEYQKELEKSNMLDFDDLLLLPYLLFKKDAEILKKWKNKFMYIMVDEAQDTNWIQFELMKMLSGNNGNITLIGDDYQSIYGRRGALMENFLNVKKYWPDIQMFKLQINYRSRPHIVTAGNHIIKNNIKQYEKDVHAHRKEDGKITVFCHNSEMDEAANIIDLISKMKDNGKIGKWGDVSILYRTNAQSSPFEQVLVQEGIPYKIRGAYKFFDRKEVKDILAYVKYLANNNDSVSLKRIINVPNRKIGKTTFEKLEEYATVNGLTLHEVIENIDSIPEKITPQAKNGIMEFKKVIHEITDHWEKYAVADAIEKITKSIKYKDYLIKEHGSEDAAMEKFENIGQLINLASKYVGNGLEAVRQFMEEITLLTDVASDTDPNSDAIKLMTTHSSKGLEFPFVFVAGLEDNVFPLTNAMMESHLLEEERRLMYVAVTRAKDYLFLSHANSRMTWGQTRSNPPSRFIGEIPQDLLKHYDLGSGGSGLGGPTKREKTFDINEGDTVNHKLFGDGYVLEIWNNLAIVKFYNPKFGVRKIEMRFLTVK